MKDTKSKTAGKINSRMFSFEILPSVSISIRSAEGLALLSKTTGNPIIFSSRRFESVLLEKLSLLLTELESSTNASSPSTDATHSDVIAELLEDVSLFRGQ